MSDDKNNVKGNMYNTDLGWNNNQGLHLLHITRFQSVTITVSY
jgi:hypothetical protein